MNNGDFQLPRRIIEKTGAHLFLTGRAGTGKTTFLRELAESCPKRTVILAPTGIAAINAGGSTIHSFFQFSFAPYLPGTHYRGEEYKLSKQKIRIIQSIGLLVIDEISMVRADLLDHIDALLRHYRSDHFTPFGGVQLLMIGDLQQLAPVVKDDEWRLLSEHYTTPYFFGSHALAKTEWLTIELTQVFRQTDAHFLDLLGKIRSQTADTQTLSEINRHYVPNFKPTTDKEYIRLVTHNNQAQAINRKELDDLEGKPYVYEASTEGNFPETSFPTDSRLELKKGAQVMFIKNDTQHRYFNGSIGKVTDLDGQGFTVRLSNGGEEIDVEPEEWENTHYVLNKETQEIIPERIGIFRQYPVKLAWAITIHKSQGLTFDRAIVDAHSAFAHGQTYVALSRLRSLDGLVLSSPIPPSAIIGDRVVNDFTSNLEKQAPTPERLELLQRNFFVGQIDTLFDLQAMRQVLDSFLRLLEENYHKTIPATISHFRNWRNEQYAALQQVAAKFHDFYAARVLTLPDYAADETLQERLKKGCRYFAEQMEPLLNDVRNTEIPENNKETLKRTKEKQKLLTDVISQMLKAFSYVESEGFDLLSYQRRRALIAAGLDGEKEREQAKEKGKPHKIQLEETEEILQPELFDMLREWRFSKMQEEKVPAYVVMSNRTLLAIANIRPLTPEALMLMPGMGPAKVSKYGDELLEIIKQSQ